MDRMIACADSRVPACRTSRAPLSSAGLKNTSLVASSLSRSSPVNVGISSHIVVAITTLRRDVSPQRFRNSRKLRADIPPIRLSRIRCI